MRQNDRVPGKIVVGIDGTDHAAAALRWAAEEAALRSATLVAVHAWSFVPVTTPADSGLVPMAWTESIEVLDASRAAAELVAAAQVREVLGEEYDVVVKVVEGGPATALSRPRPTRTCSSSATRVAATSRRRCSARRRPRSPTPRRARS